MAWNAKITLTIWQKKGITGQWHYYNAVVFKPGVNFLTPIFVS
jgi:hypothetical protein